VKITDDTVHVRLWEVWYEDVADGRRTADVQIMSDDEWDALNEAQPQYIHLTNAQTGATLRRRITYLASVGELPSVRRVGGNHVVLICFEEEEK
jgi:hypothetical protein